MRRIGWCVRKQFKGSSSLFFVTFGLVKYVFVPKANTIVDLVTLMGSSVGQRP